jgi:ATP/maltotriose-dependent transcriptional regulator MalT
MILARRRLLARVGSSEPRLVRLCAPPGYGKTDVAALWARRFDRHAICDCRAVTGTADFAGRLMSALADETRGSGETIARTRLLLHVTQAGDAAWSRALIEAWKLRQERALLILEGADALASHPAALALLGDLLAARPEDRVVLTVSRTPLPLDVARYLAPHQMLSFSSDELKLDDGEAAGVFAGTEVAPSVVDRMLQLAAGWPIALLLLSRIAHYEPEIEALLERLGDAGINLPEYLVNEILSALTPEMTDTLLAAAAIPQATLEDISVATGLSHAAPAIEGLLRLPGFISYESGTYHIHPVLESALRARHGVDFSGLVLRAARGNESVGDFLRAAELFIVAGQFEEAAAAIDRLPLNALAQPTPRVIAALAKIPLANIAARANLWIATLQYRRGVVDVGRLYREAVALCAGDPAVTPTLYRRLGVRRAMLALELDRLGEARATLDEAAAGSPPDAPEEQRLFLMTAAVVAARQGRFFDADACVEEADAVHAARHLRFDDERAQIAAEKALAHGDWDDLLRIAEERLAATQSTGPTERIGEAARIVARAAWYCDDDDRVAAALQIVSDCAVDTISPDESLADWRSALTTDDSERASEAFARAIEAADAGENDFLRIVIRVCAASLLPGQRRRLLEARAISQRIESPSLQTSLELLIDSNEQRDYGIFRYLGARLRRSPLKTQQERLFVDVLQGEVRRGSEVLHVSDRGLELLAALALSATGTTNEELAGALWPALDRRDALNALKMCVSRTRAQVGDRESIQNGRNGYELGAHIESDVREYERLLQDARGAGALGEAMRFQVRRFLNANGDHRPAHTLQWAWFAPHGRRLDELRGKLSRALAIGA